MRKPERLANLRWQTCYLWQRWKQQCWYVPSVGQGGIVSPIHAADLEWWQTSMKADDVFIS